MLLNPSHQTPALGHSWQQVPRRASHIPLTVTEPCPPLGRFGYELPIRLAGAPICFWRSAASRSPRLAAAGNLPWT